jgi:hypothetical protein
LLKLNINHENVLCCSVLDWQNEAHKIQFLFHFIFQKNPKIETLLQLEFNYYHHKIVIFAKVRRINDLHPP